MQIIEIYRSIQGESSFAGIPCVFVRLAACNLRCVWCDSEYTFTGGKKMTADEVEQEGMRLAPLPRDSATDVQGRRAAGTPAPDSLVEITGGEPMPHERRLVPFMERLLARGYPRRVATSG